MEPGFLHAHFIVIDPAAAVQVVLLGIVGGVLSGFIGSGGAFFMTPGMMNLGVPGVVAVASNITHKFGKAMVGSRKHAELGNVDKRLGLYLILTSFIGIRIAVWINSSLFEGGGGDGHGAGGSAAADLYISAVFVFILAYMRVEGREPWWLTLTVSLAMTVACYVLFDQLLRIVWPQTVLGQALPALRAFVPSL